MNDRELLEAAATAAGLDDAKFKDMEGWGEVRYGYSSAIWSEKLFNEEGTGYWNPLVDDAQALRLAVKLSIRLRGPGFAETLDGRPCVEGVGADEYANTRRAIVRAAIATHEEDEAMALERPPRVRSASLGALMAVTQEKNKLKTALELACVYLTDEQAAEIGALIAPPQSKDDQTHE